MTGTDAGPLGVLYNELNVLRDRIQAARAIHAPLDAGKCECCFQTWPCPTIDALNGKDTE